MMNFNAFEEEIRAAEANIVLNRMELDAALSNATRQARETARNALTSPAFLIGALGLGIAAGHLVFRRRVVETPSTAATVAKKSMWGILAGAAFSLVQAHFGGPVGMARWAMEKIAERKYGAVHRQHESARQPLYH